MIYKGLAKRQKNKDKGLCSRLGENRILSFFLALFLFASCDKPTILLNQPNEDVRSLGGFIGNNYDYSLLAAAMEYTGLMDTLNNPGEYTLLAPSNTAFRDLGMRSEDDIRKLNRDSLRRVLSYHILPYILREDDVPLDVPDLRYPALSGDSLYVSRVKSTISDLKYVMRGGSSSFYSNYGITFSGVDGMDTDKSYSNGVLHTVSKLIKPMPELTVQQWLERHAEYSVFVAGLKKFELWDELAQQGPFTIFAPKNLYLEREGITQYFVDTLHTENFIGPRLFGSYIMYNKFYFILDNHFYLHRDQQFWYFKEVKNDPGIYQVFYCSTGGIPTFTSDARGMNRLQYGLGVSYTPRPYVSGARNDYLGGVSYLPSGNTVPFSIGVSPSLNDYICSNGLIHDLQGVLVLPNLSRTSTDF